MMVDDIKKSILQEAYSGKLTRQSKDDYSFKNNNLLNLNSITKKGKFIFDESYLYKIPESWIWIKLDNIITILGDGLHGTPEYDESGEYFFVNGNNLKDGQIILKQDTKRVSKNEYNKYKKNLNCNTMFISINGTIGNIGFYNNEKIILGKSACYFNLLDYVNKKYLYYFFKSKWALDYMINNATGTTIKNVSLDVMRNIRIPFAPLEEQQRIVDKIESLFTKLDEIKPIEEELMKIKLRFSEDMKNSIIQSAVSGCLTTQNPLESVNSIIEQIENKINKKLRNVHNYPFEIPKNWLWIKFGDLVNFEIGKTPPRADSSFWNGDFNWVSISDMIENGRINATKETVSFKANNELFKGRISKTGTLLMSFKLTVGRCSILNVDAFHNEGIISIYPNYDSVILKEYLFKILPYIVKFGDTKGAIKGNTLNSKSLDNLMIPLPPIEEQKRIVDKLETLLPLCNDISKLINS